MAKLLLRRADAGALPVPNLLDTDAIAALSRSELEETCRSLVSPVYLGGHVTLSRVLGRYKLYLDSRDQDFGGHVLLDGFWESWITRFIARLVRPGWTVADVGANYGYYTLLLADLVGPKGRVVAVEPNPAAAALLRRSVALNGFAARTTVCNLAAGDAGEQEATLWVPEWSPGHAAVSPVVEAPAGVDSFTVPVAALDDLLAPGRRLDFLKIDAEGSEERIISGMSGIFAVHRPAMVLEFNAIRYQDPAAFLGRLTGLYGSLSHIDYEGRAVAIEPARVLTENVGQEWLLFLSAS
jgi:FkbM family methyltransferase